MRPIAALVCGTLALVFVACRERQPPPAAAVPPTAEPAVAHAPVQTEMRNVRLRVADGIVLHIRYLRGEMISRTPGQPPVFDDGSSYRIHVISADVGMDMSSLTRLMNDRAFGYKGSPVSDVKVSIDHDRLKVSGKLQKGVPLPFSVESSVEAAADGRMRLHAESIHVLGLPATRLLDLFGVSMQDLVDLKQRRGVEIVDDDIVVAPGGVLPPPEIEGRLTHVGVAGGELRETFLETGAHPPRLGAADPAARNYIYLYGSTIRFGKLTMSDTDLQLIDADPRDDFDFYPEQYLRQLVAGYSRTTPSGGLRAYLPDFGDLNRGVVVRPRGR